MVSRVLSAQTSVFFARFLRKPLTVPRLSRLGLVSERVFDAIAPTAHRRRPAIAMNYAIIKPDFGPDGCLFPELPIIKSDPIRLQVFTHRSYYARPTHVFEDAPYDLSPDNEKYEHLGDTVLGMLITDMLSTMYPGLRVGPSTKIRAMIVGNPTLAEISRRYRLPDRLHLHPAQAITLRASTNVQADVFEAFVGGLFKDQGIEVTKKWLESLFRPYAQAAYQIARQQHGLPPLPPSFDKLKLKQSSSSDSDTSSSSSSVGSDIGVREHSTTRPPTTTRTTTPAGVVGTRMTMPSYPRPDDALRAGEILTPPTNIGHLALFNQHLQKTNREVEWIYSDGSSCSNGDVGGGGYNDMGLPAEVMIRGTKTTPVWYVKVLVDGTLHGRGRGNTKRAARNEAAKEGLCKLGIVDV